LESAMHCIAVWSFVLVLGVSKIGAERGHDMQTLSHAFSKNTEVAEVSKHNADAVLQDIQGRNAFSALGKNREYQQADENRRRLDTLGPWIPNFWTNDLIYDQDLACGGFGCTTRVKVKHCDGNVYLTMKAISYGAKDVHNFWYNLAQQEIEGMQAIQQAVHSRHVAKIHGTGYKAKDFYEYHVVYLMDYYNSGSFDEAIMKKFQAHQNAAFFIQVLRGVTALHQAGWLHNDLKPDNVMITCADKMPKCDAVIIDFGLATPIGTSDRRGSPGWMAPEVAKRLNSSDKSDIFSLGAMLYFMRFKTLPYRLATNPKEVYAFIKIFDPSRDPRIQFLLGGSGNAFPKTISSIWNFQALPDLCEPVAFDLLRWAIINITGLRGVDVVYGQKPTISGGSQIMPITIIPALGVSVQYLTNMVADLKANLSKSIPQIYAECKKIKSVEYAAPTIKVFHEQTDWEVKNETLDSFPDTDKTLGETIVQMMAHNPADRPSLSEIESKLNAIFEPKDDRSHEYREYRELLDHDVSKEPTCVKLASSALLKVNSSDNQCLEYAVSSGMGSLVSSTRKVTTNECQKWFQPKENQKWYFDGTALKAKKGNTKCLEATAAKVQLSTMCTGEANQQWFWDGAFLKTKADNTMCLTSMAGLVGMAVCNGENNQQWYFHLDDRG